MNNFNSFILVGLLIITINIVQAESIYKCENNDGTITYQSKECENTGKKFERSKNRYDSFVGCYIGLPPPVSKYRSHDVRYKVQKLGSGRYEIFQFDDGKFLEKFSTKLATTEDLSTLNEWFEKPKGVRFLYGLSSDWDLQNKGTMRPGSYHPTGIYAAKDKNNNNIYITYMAVKGGLVKRIECDASMNSAVHKVSQSAESKSSEITKSTSTKLSRPNIAKGCDKADLNNGTICVGKLIKDTNNISEAKDSYLHYISQSLHVKNLIMIASENEYVRTGRHTGNACSLQEKITGITPTDSVVCESWNSSWYCKQTFRWECNNK